MNFDKKINAINKLVKSNVLSENEARLCIMALRAHCQNSPSNEISYLKNKTLIYDNQGIKYFISTLIQMREIITITTTVLVFILV